MFKNGTSKPEKPASDVTVINRGTTVEGEVEVSGTIRVYGRLNGTIRSEGKVIVAEEGFLRGDIYADAADVSGTVEGLIEANRLDLRDTATVEGNVVVKKFTAETGAVFVGDCKMPQNGALPPESKKASAEDAADGETARDDDADEKDASSQDTEKKAAKKAEVSSDAAENGNGVKPLPKKPDDAEPQAEEAGVPSEEGSSTRPRFW